MRYYLRQKCDQCMLPVVGLCLVIGMLVLVVRVIFA
jgi:hypothetical protein